MAVTTEAEERTILLLGDSISAAYGMSLEQGWVSLLQEQLASTEHSARIVNASISGETSDGGVRRLPALLEKHRPDLLLIQLGGNDGLRGFPLSRLRENLTQMVRAAQTAGARVLLLPMEIPPNYGARYTSEFRETFVAVARETGAALAPFILAAFATDPSMMQEDGIHPRSEAQPLIVKEVMPNILRMLDTP